MAEKNFSNAAEAFISKNSSKEKPVKSQGKNKEYADKNISLKVSEDFYNEIFQTAKSHELTMAAYIKMVVKKAINNQE